MRGKILLLVSVVPGKRRGFWKHPSGRGGRLCSAEHYQGLWRGCRPGLRVIYEDFSCCKINLCPRSAARVAATSFPRRFVYRLTIRACPDASRSSDYNVSFVLDKKNCTTYRDGLVREECFNLQILLKRHILRKNVDR